MKGIIYALKSKGKVVYVGRTTDYAKRKSDYKHKIHDKTNHLYNNKLYKYMRANKVSISKLHEMNIGNADDRKELRRVEHGFIQMHQPVLNTQTKYRTPK